MLGKLTKRAKIKGAKYEIFGLAMPIRIGYACYGKNCDRDVILEQ